MEREEREGVAAKVRHLRSGLLGTSSNMINLLPNTYRLSGGEPNGRSQCGSSC